MPALKGPAYILALKGPTYFWFAVRPVLAAERWRRHDVRIPERRRRRDVRIPERRRRRDVRIAERRRWRVVPVAENRRRRVRFRYSFRYSRRRRVCVRLTGISVAFASFILRM
jgi:hypothetical protein